jgi:CRP/FNR family transcriptional regulator, cyclic AMP receptor protein
VAREADPSAGAAVARSFLATLSDATLTRLIDGANRLDVPAGSILYREGEAPRFGLVVDGLIRIFLTSAEGRQLTVRYARAGAAIGAPTAVGGPVDVSAQALTDSVLLMLNVDVLRSEANRDPILAWALAEEISRRLYEVLEAMSGNVFGSVRQRVARHLLDLAADRPQGGVLVAPVSQQELADAVGTAREVVARTLRDFHESGLTEAARGGIRLVDPEGLSKIAARDM